VSVFPDKVQEGEMLWVDAESPTAQELADLKSRFDLDDYAIEDVVHRNQRPKLEEYGKNVFAVIHVPDVRSHKSGINELFVFFQKNWIITIHSDDSELIHSIDSRIRARGLAPLTTTPSPDLFFYVFLDFAVDAYYPILDEVEERLEDLDKQAITTFRTRVKRMENVVAIITTIGGVRRKLMILRRSLTPTRDMIGW
jgi:magnesium transporter